MTYAVAAREKPNEDSALLNLCYLTSNEKASSERTEEELEEAKEEILKVADSILKRDF